jgi:Recombinase
MRHKQSQGEYIGGKALYGFQLIDGELVEDDFEQDVIRQAKVLRQSGLSLAAVAKDLAKTGIRTRNNKVFDATQIRRMVA